MVPTGNKAKRLLSVNHTAKTIHHHYQRSSNDDFLYGNDYDDINEGNSWRIQTKTLQCHVN